MSKARTTVVTKLVAAATLVLFMVAQHPGVLSSAEAVKATTAVKHKPLKHFVAGHRIQVEAKVADPQGVSLVRCYFRAVGQADYVFVGMRAGEKDTFTGILPAPAAETKNIEYLFLAVNGKNQVVKTQTFRTDVKAAADIPEWQKGGGEGQVAVSSELPRIAAPTGFSDSITFDSVESSARFGVVAGIYGSLRGAGGSPGAAAGEGAAAAATATGAAAAATSAGAVTASTGLSTTVIVGAGAGAVAVGIGVAVAGAGSQSEDTGTSGSGGSDSLKSGCEQYAGNWAGGSSGTTCAGNSDPGGYDPNTMTVRSDCNVEFCGEGRDGGYECGPFTIEENPFTFSEVGECGGQTVFKCEFTSSTTFSCTFSGDANGSMSLTKQ